MNNTKLLFVLAVLLLYVVGSLGNDSMRISTPVASERQDKLERLADLTKV